MPINAVVVDVTNPIQECATALVVDIKSVLSGTFKCALPEYKPGGNSTKTLATVFDVAEVKETFTARWARPNSTCDASLMAITGIGKCLNNVPNPCGTELDRTTSPAFEKVGSK